MLTSKIIRPLALLVLITGCAAQVMPQSTTTELSEKAGSEMVVNEVAPIVVAVVNTPSTTPLISERDEFADIKFNTYREHPSFAEISARIAERNQLPKAWVEDLLAQARFDADVRRLIAPTKGRSGKRNWRGYRNRFVEIERILRGRTFMRRHAETLKRAEERFGVPGTIIGAVIGVETVYGRVQGRFRVLDALATLALSYPDSKRDRSKFFSSELEAFFKLCHQLRCDPNRLHGSYAGAIGISQFMPSNILTLAVDFDGNGKIELRESEIDAIGSVANYLAHHGWQAGLTTHYAIRWRESVNLEPLLKNDILPSLSRENLWQWGAWFADDPPPKSDDEMFAVIRLINSSPPDDFVIGTKNFYTITRYNHSSFYAMAVIELAAALDKR